MNHLDICLVSLDNVTMGRQLRLQFPHALYHVDARGNNKKKIYKTDEDKELFMEVLSQTIERYLGAVMTECGVEIGGTFEELDYFLGCLIAEIAEASSAMRKLLEAVYDAVQVELSAQQ